MADNKFAAYLCGGCGLAERLDLGRLEKVAQKEGKMALVRTHEFLCSTVGVQAIRSDIDNEGVTHIAIAACSRRAKTEAFDFPDVPVARANLREGVIWARPATDAARETTQEMAEDYVRMACAEVKKVKLPAPNPEAATERRLLVVGGGVSGLTAALEAADSGYEVVLVEKRATLGGQVGALWKRVPPREPFDDPIETGMAELVARASSHPNIRLHLGSTLAETAGAPGRFRVTLARDGGTAGETVKVGAIVQATGFTTYDVAKLPELGGGANPDVVDQAGFEKLALETLGRGKALARPSDGAR